MPRNPWQDLEWRLAAATVSGSTAVIVAAILVTRLGAAGHGVSAWWTLTTAVLVGTLSAVCVELLERHQGSRFRETSRVVGAIFASGVTSVAVLATATRAGTSQLAFACLLCLLFTVAAVTWAIGRSRRTVNEVTQATSSTSTETVPSAHAIQKDGLPDHVEQTLSRYLAEGRDHLEACVRVRFEPGQQSAIVHLPIQPAMQGVPEVECEPAGEEELRITVDPAQPYGVRLVCRRPAHSKEAGEAIVSVLISADRIARVAA